MRKFVILVCFTAAICGCVKRDKWLPWTGPKEISAEGGVAIWTPKVEDPHCSNVIDLVVIHIQSEEKVIDYESIENPGKRIKGDWYEIVNNPDNIAITFDPNDTQYFRVINVYLSTNMGDCFRVTQKPSDSLTY